MLKNQLNGSILQIRNSQAKRFTTNARTQKQNRHRRRRHRQQQQPFICHT